MYDISASLVVFNPRVEYLLETITSFCNCKLDIKLIIIDHSPISNSDYLKSFINVSYIHDPSNPGFGAGHNNGIRYLKFNSKYHLILNPDVYFEKGTLEKIFDFMNLNQNVGHLMPKVLFPDKSFQYLCKKNPTVFDMFARGFLPNPIKSFFSNRLDNFEYKCFNFDEMIFDVPYLSGCFMFFRVSTLKSVGFFDESIFMYLEDADITRRFLNVSRTVYFPSATVYHHYSGLTHKKLKYKWITVQSAIKYFNKWGWFSHLI